MIQRALRILPVLGLAACWGTTSTPPPKTPPPPPPKQEPVQPTPPPRAVQINIDGSWSEDWSTPGQTDVNYHDIYVISGSLGTLSVTAPERPGFRFGAMKYEKQELTVHLENNGTTIDYVLEVQSPTKIVGRAWTNRGLDVPIVWNKIEK